jgi:hypothetical protein
MLRRLNHEHPEAEHLVFFRFGCRHCQMLIAQAQIGGKIGDPKVTWAGVFAPAEPQSEWIYRRFARLSRNGQTAVLKDFASAVATNSAPTSVEAWARSRPELREDPKTEAPPVAEQLAQAISPNYTPYYLRRTRQEWSPKHVSELTRFLLDRG